MGHLGPSMDDRCGSNSPQLDFLSNFPSPNSKDSLELSPRLCLMDSTWTTVRTHSMSQTLINVNPCHRSLLPSLNVHRVADFNASCRINNHVALWDSWTFYDIVRGHSWLFVAIPNTESLSWVLVLWWEHNVPRFKIKRLRFGKSLAGNLIHPTGRNGHGKVDEESSKIHQPWRPSPTV